MASRFPVRHRQAPAIVNFGMVNGRASYFSPAAFCEILRVFASIRRFQNPVNHRFLRALTPKINFRWHRKPATTNFLLRHIKRLSVSIARPARNA